MKNYDSDKDERNSGVSRRQFGKLLAAGVGGTALGISGSAAAKGITRSQPPFLHQTGKPFSGEHSVDVVIVGAGLSGLTAARELKRKGKSVLILESRNRIGGRMFLNKTIKGGVLDMGGQWVGKTQYAMQGLVTELGVEKFDSYEEGWSILSWEGQKTGFNGNVAEILEGRCEKPVDFPLNCKSPKIAETPCDKTSADQLAQKILWDKFLAISNTVPKDKPWLAKNAKWLDSQTFQTWLDKETTLPYTKWPSAMQSRIGGSGGFEPAQASLLHMAWTQQVGAQSETPEQWLLKGGAGQIPPILAKELGNRIVLSAMVTGIFHDASGVTVTAAGLTIKAGAVIVAIPPAMRAGIHFSPALPPVHAGFIQRAPMGSMSKVHAVYNTPFWRDSCLSGSAAGNLAGDLAGSSSELKTCEFIADSSPPPGTPSALLPGILTSFIAGERNLELSHASAQEVRKAVLDDFVYYFGPEAANPVQFVHFDWNNQNWTGGAFTAHMSPGVWTAYGAGWREPVGNIFWAGTETSNLWPGYFDGAVHAGKNAAADVLLRGILRKAA